MAQVEQGSLTSFYTHLSLYEKVNYPDTNMAEMALAIHGFDGNFDEYCPGCGATATLLPVSLDPFSEDRESRALVDASNNFMHGCATAAVDYEFKKSFRCSRGSHKFTYTFRFLGDTIVKVGQYPSMADIGIGDVKQFNKVLGKDNYGALTKAIGLHSHGIGAGALIYLRRIFESLVEEAHELAKNDKGWNEAAYGGLRMNEKLQVLTGHLPELLSSNYAMYSILSEHIHSLSEDECKANFNFAKEGILLIAEEKLEKQQKEKRKEAFLQERGDLMSRRANGKAAKAD